VAFIASTTSSMPPCFDPVEQAGDGQVFGPHAFERGEPPAQHVIAPGEQPRAVERPEVGHVLDHAQRSRIAARIGADAARIGGIDIAAGPAFDQPLAHRFERLEQLHQRGLAPLDQPQHRAPRRARAKPRQARQRGGQRLDLLRCHDGQIGPDTSQTESQSQLMRIIFMGTPDFAVPALKRWSRRGTRSSPPIRQPPRPGGRRARN
jgi:hypothetical protein